MLLDRIASLATKELLRLSNVIADAYQLSTVNSDGPSPQLLLSLLAFCNHERVVRTLQRRRASRPVTAAAGQRQPQQRLTSRRGKSAKPVIH
jgi:hypothetical protein